MYPNKKSITFFFVASLTIPLLLGCPSEGLLNPSTLNQDLTLWSVANEAGPTTGGDTIMVWGTGFLPGLTITIGGSTCNSPALVSVNQARCNTPVKAAGAYDVVLTSPNGQSARLSNAYTYQAAPTLTAISPNVSPTEGGGWIEITGTHFNEGVSWMLPFVTIGGTGCTSSFLKRLAINSATSAGCNAPAKPAGTYDVVFTNGDGQTVTLPQAYTYRDAPTLTSLFPTSGPPGTLLTLNGTGFLTGLTVRVGGTSCTTVTVQGPNEILCNLPIKPASGALAIVVTNPNSNGSSTLASAYTYP